MGTALRLWVCRADGVVKLTEIALIKVFDNVLKGNLFGSALFHIFNNGFPRFKLGIADYAAVCRADFVGVLDRKSVV